MTDTSTTRIRAATPDGRYNGINWDLLGYSTRAEAEAALACLLAGGNSVHGDARAYLIDNGDPDPTDGLHWVKSHYYNDRHPSGY